MNVRRIVVRTCPTALAVALLLAAPARAQDDDTPADWPPPPGASGGELLPSQACYDVQHYALELDVLPDEQTIAGTLTLTADITQATHSLSLHLDHHLTVYDVELDAAEREVITWIHEDGLVRVGTERDLALGEEIRLAVTYGGAPRVAPRPPWDGGFAWGQTTDGSPWVATSCQGEGADLWWPCKDHPSDKPDRGMDLLIRVPEGLVVAANGELVRELPRDDGMHLWHWRTELPVSNYCIALNIAPYVTVEAEGVTSVTGEPLPFTFWCLPEDEDAAREILPQFVDHMRFFEETCGPYAFRGEKYGIAQTPHLGMEHQTIIAYGNDFRSGAYEDYDWLHHHELAHEWWGNLVTCRDWKDMWIHEGIGTYMQPLYLERKFGKLAYMAEMAKQRRQLRNIKPVAPRRSMDSHEIYFIDDGSFDNDIYAKGSWVMHTLRWVMGDDAFFRALRRMAYPDESLEATTDGSAVRLTDTDEILAIAQRIAGQDLSWFEAVYLRQPALPVLHVERDERGLELRWETPNDLPFPMPVPIWVDEVPRRVAMPEGRALLAIDPDSDVRIDPSNRVLRADQTFDLPDLDARGRPVAVRKR